MKITKDIFLYPQKHIEDTISEKDKDLYEALYNFLESPYEYHYPIDNYQAEYGKILIDFDMYRQETGCWSHTTKDGEFKIAAGPITGFIISEYMFGVKIHCPCNENHYNNIAIDWFNPRNIIKMTNIENDDKYSSIGDLCDNLLISVAKPVVDFKANIWKEAPRECHIPNFILPKSASNLLKAYIMELNSVSPDLISCDVNGTVYGIPLGKRPFLRM